jgi:hypothetical protein
MNAVDDGANRWDKLENKKVETLSERTKGIRGILTFQIRNIIYKESTIYLSVFSRPEVINEFERLL